MPNVARSGHAGREALRDQNTSVVPADHPPTHSGSDLISQKVFMKSFCKSHSPHKSVNLFFMSVIVKDELTDFWGS